MFSKLLLITNTRYQVDAENYEQEGLLKKICEQRGYTYLDEIYISPEKLPDYDAKLKVFYQEVSQKRIAARELSRNFG